MHTHFWWQGANVNNNKMSEATRKMQKHEAINTCGLSQNHYILSRLVAFCSQPHRHHNQGRDHRGGEMVHGQCVKLGFVFDRFVGNTLMMMYCFYGKMVDARYVSDEMPKHCVVSWTVLISGYVKVGDVEVARLAFGEVPFKDRGVWGAMISGYVFNVILFIIIMEGKWIQEFCDSIEKLESNY